jgi:hypothetical protein
MDNQTKNGWLTPGKLWIILWVVTIVVCLYQYHIGSLFENQLYCTTLNYRNSLKLIEPQNLLGLFALIFTGFVLTKSVQYLALEYPLFGKYWMPITASSIFLILLLLNNYC